MDSANSIDRLGIVGTGRVAHALGSLLAEQSKSAPLVWGRTKAKAGALADRIGANQPATKIGELAQACNVIMIAVSDDAIGDVVKQLAAIASINPGTLVFHVSGRSGSSILSPLAKKGMQTAAIHPVMTFTGRVEADMGNVAGAHFAITAGQVDAEQDAKAIVSALGGEAFEVSEDKRIVYHAALSHVANHLVTLVAQASAMLGEAGIADPGQVMSPLVRAALNNSLENGFAALSGPLLRGDEETICGHLEAIDLSCPEISATYRALAKATLEQLARSGKQVDPAFLAKLDPLSL